MFDLPSGVILRRLDCATLNPNAKHDPNNEERGVSEIQVVELALKPGKREPAWGILKRFRNENPVSVVELPGPGPLVEPDMELWDGTQPSTEPDAVAELMEEVERLKKREAELVKANEALFRVARKEL